MAIIETGPLRQAGMREQNLALVLRDIAAHAPVTRADVATRTGLTKSSVSGLVRDLLDAGLLWEEGLRRGGDRGRPGTVLALNGAGAAGLGLELNVDYVAAAVVDLAGQVRYRHVVAEDNRTRSQSDVIGSLARLAEDAATAAAQQHLTLAGCCVAVPGLVDAGNSRVLRAPNLDWTDVPIIELLGERLPLTSLGSTVDNEANLAALGELWFGDGRDFGDYVHVSGEIGIGAGVVVDGRIFRGSHGVAGEIGHVVVDRDGPPCSCGGQGCLERFAGQEAILAMAGVSATPVNGGRAMTELLQLLERADRDAVASVETAAGHLGVALSSAVNIVDPDVVVLGGIFAPLAPWLLRPLADTLRRHAPIYGSRLPEVRVSRLGADAAVRGAAGTVTQRIIAHPGEFLTRRASFR